MNISLSQSLDDLSLYPGKRFRKKSPKILKKIPNYHTMSSLKLHPDKYKRETSFSFGIVNPNSIFTRNHQINNSSSFHLTPIKEAPSSLVQFTSSVLKNKYDLIQVLQELEKSSQEPDIKKAKAASKALDICSNEAGSYQKEMQLITSEISKSLYMNKKELPEEALEKIYDKHIGKCIQRCPIRWRNSLFYYCRYI
ncbi:unnamed protein product [Blepharisma stoltei]|uniref:Uncharacterized protein n=1 Tax=Blepharisma stoltei TaxID=1481888 RepID=A0AAU9JPV7_9CILI|nr:unnamed protein product [Blepharisma stoltei]